MEERPAEIGRGTHSGKSRPIVNCYLLAVAWHPPCVFLCRPPTTRILLGSYQGRSFGVYQASRERSPGVANQRTQLVDMIHANVSSTLSNNAPLVFSDVASFYLVKRLSPPDGLSTTFDTRLVNNQTSCRLLKLSLLANENDHPQRPMRKRTPLTFRASDRRSTKAHDKHDGLSETYSGTPSVRSARTRKVPDVQVDVSEESVVTLVRVFGVIRVRHEYRLQHLPHIVKIVHVIGYQLHRRQH
jgi:hypothetical protein